MSLRGNVFNTGRVLPWLLAGLVLLSGIFINAWFWQFENQQRNLSISAALESQADQITTNLSNRLNTFQVVMRGVQGLFLGSNSVGPEEFRNYVNSLEITEQLQGVQAIAYVQLLSNEELPVFLERMQIAISPDFSLSPAGERDSYAPITYIEPLAGNEGAQGFDVFTQPLARIAMERTLVDNSYSISAPLTLVQDANTNGTSAFVMYLPIYRQGMPLATLAQRQAAISGWVDVPFRMNDLMTGIQGEYNPAIRLEIHDGEPSTDSQLYLSPALSAGRFTTFRLLDFGGRQWTLNISTSPLFESAMPGQTQIMLTLGLGMSLTLLLAFLVWLMARGRYSAEARFRRLFTRAGDGILIFSRNYTIIDANPAAQRIFAYSQNDLLRCTLPDLLDESGQKNLENEITRIKPGSLHLTEWNHVTRDGQIFPAEICASQLDDDHYFTILRDLTAQKAAQQRILRLTQLYRALSATNHSIIRRSDEESLFRRICEIAVEFGGMKLAWIGMLNREHTSIDALAAHGAGLEKLQQLRISASEDQPEGRGATGTALRESRPVIINDYQHDTGAGTWQQLAGTIGWKSQAAFPILRNNKPFAVLSVYHPDTNAFDVEAVELLSEMAGDLSFALDNIDREKQRILSEQALKESEEKMALVLDNVGAYIYLKDKAGKYIYANQQVLDRYGLNSEEIIGKSDENLFDYESVQALRENDRRVLQDGETIQEEEVTIERNGLSRNVYWSVKLPLRRANGNIYGLCGISTNITAHKQTEESLKLNAKVFESSRDGIEITDSQNRIVAINKAYTEITGYEEAEVLGRNPSMFSSGEHNQEFYHDMWHQIHQNGFWEGEIINRRKNGENYPQWISINVIRNDEGKITHHIGILSDLTDHKAKEDRIKFLSHYDTLTLLPNRKLLIDHSRIAISKARKTNSQLALFAIDLDRFKIINESLGPSIGDLLLKSFSERLLEYLQPGQTLCRQGGDDFLLLLPDCNADHAAHLAGTLLHLISQPFQIRDHRLSLTASIGIALYPDDASDFEQLTQAADAAMFRAKRSNPGSFQLFTRQMHEAVNKILQIESDLRIAIEQQQFEIHYQPQVDSHSLAITGCEALIRWRHPEMGMISPAQFIPVAEESGLIVEIGDWTLKEVTRQLVSWQQKGLPIVPVAINLSAVQFRLDSFYDSVADALEEAALPSRFLALELTERIAMEDSERTIELLEKFDRLGVSLAIDDFGMGYSSLGYLKRFQVDTLKIDQSFVQGLGQDAEDEAIVNAIIGMAQGLDFKTLAEGVETEQQLAYLQKRGCHEIQGYYIARPLPAEQFAVFLADSKPVFQ